MKHKKSVHVEHDPPSPCNNFLNDICKCSDSQCWYKHIKSHESPSQPVRSSEEGNQSEKSTSSHQEQQVFQEGSGSLFPPDQMMSNEQSEQKNRNDRGKIRNSDKLKEKNKDSEENMETIKSN